MTSHELAQQLLAGPNLPVELHVATPHDTYIGDLGECTISVGIIDVEGAALRGYPGTQPGQCLVLRGWQSSEESE